MHLPAWIGLPVRGGSLAYRRSEMSDTHPTRLLMTPTAVAATLFDRSDDSANYS